MYHTRWSCLLIINPTVQSITIQKELLTEYKCVTIDTYISMTGSEPSCDSISEFTACTAGLTSTLSNLKFDRVFHLLLSLSKTCISSLKLYL
jgi:hypothetical protein